MGSLTKTLGLGGGLTSLGQGECLNWRQREATPNQGTTLTSELRSKRWLSSITSSHIAKLTKRYHPPDEKAYPALKGQTNKSSIGTCLSLGKSEPSLTYNYKSPSQKQ